MAQAQRAGIRDVAKRAGVSMSTVSNVLNNPDVVAETTRETVLAVIKELKYVPNVAARGLRSRAALTFGAVVYDLANPYYTELIRGIEDRLAEDDAMLFVCSTDEDPQREATLLAQLQERGVQVAFVAPADDELECERRCQELGMPIVLLSRPREGIGISTVHVDDVEGAALAIDHLLTLGHRRIAFINGPRTIEGCVDRADGAVKAITARGLDPAEVFREVNVSLPNADGGEAVLETLLSDAHRPTAIFCVNDLVGLGVLRGMRHRGLDAPRDIAVVGYDDLEFSGMLSTPLTSVRQPKYQVGRAAAELMLRAAEGDLEPQHVLFHAELVVRESSRAMRRPRTYLH